MPIGRVARSSVFSPLKVGILVVKYKHGIAENPHLTSSIDTSVELVARNGICSSQLSKSSSQLLTEIEISQAKLALA